MYCIVVLYCKVHFTIDRIKGGLRFFNYELQNPKLDLHPYKSEKQSQGKHPTSIF